MRAITRGVELPRRHRTALAWLVLLWTLGLSAPAAPMPPQAENGQVGAAVDAEALDLDPQRSTIVVRVYRAGPLAVLGHNHTVEVTGLQGELRRRSDGTGSARLVVRPEQLRVDHPAARLAAGEGFASMPDATAIEATRRNMLAEQVLDAQRWPEITIDARIDELDTGSAQAEIALTLRGLSRRYSVPVSVARERAAWVVSGVLTLQQSSFGMVPFSVFGGALRVRDAVEVDFRIVGRTAAALL